MSDQPTDPRQPDSDRPTAPPPADPQQPDDDRPAAPPPGDLQQPAPQHPYSGYQQYPQQGGYPQSYPQGYQQRGGYSPGYPQQPGHGLQGGYPQPPGAYPQSPGSHPQNQPSTLGGLFDLGFDQRITPGLAKVVHIAVMVLAAMIAVVGVLVALGAFAAAGDPFIGGGSLAFSGLVLLIGGPLVGFITLAFGRFWLEFLLDRAAQREEPRQ